MREGQGERPIHIRPAFEPVHRELSGEFVHIREETGEVHEIESQPINFEAAFGDPQKAYDILFRYLDVGDFEIEPYVFEKLIAALINSFWAIKLIVANTSIPLDRKYIEFIIHSINNRKIDGLVEYHINDLFLSPKLENADIEFVLCAILKHSAYSYNVYDALKALVKIKNKFSEDKYLDYRKKIIDKLTYVDTSSADNLRQSLSIKENRLQSCLKDGSLELSSIEIEKIFESLSIYLHSQFWKGKVEKKYSIVKLSAILISVDIPTLFAGKLVIKRAIKDSTRGEFNAVINNIKNATNLSDDEKRKRIQFLKSLKEGSDLEGQLSLVSSGSATVGVLSLTDSDSKKPKK